MTWTKMSRLAVLMAIAIVGVPIVGASERSRIKADLSGYEEVPTLSTPASGEFRARVRASETSIEYELSYRDTETPVTQAHLHLGAIAVNGPIVVFLCTNLGNGPAGTQGCPAAPATISGTIQADDVGGGAEGLGLAAGEFDELLRAIRAGAIYVNVHTTGRPLGEIRGQLDGQHGHNHDN